MDLDQDEMYEQAKKSGESLVDLRSKLKDTDIDGIKDDLKHGLTYSEFKNKHGLSRYKAKQVIDYLSLEGHRIAEERITEAGKKQYVLQGDGEEPPNYVESKRQTAHQKGSITNEARKHLEELERQVKRYRKDVGPLSPSKSEAYTPGSKDLVIHRSDDHFGDLVKDKHGQKVYDSEIAEEVVRSTFDEIIANVDADEVDNVHLLMGGDHVTNEAIYESQPHDIDETIDRQLDRATAVYMDQIQRLAEKYGFVQVACQGGNHGEFRVSGSSKKANADDLMFNRLEMIAKYAGMDNVRFVKSDRSDHVNVEIRGHKAHLRHGDNVRNHIGTSSPKSDWLSFLNEYEFDIAYRGHYHSHKVEHVNGVPVLMAPAPKPSGDWEGSLGLFEVPMSYYHFATDERPLEQIKYINHEI